MRERAAEMRAALIETGSESEDRTCIYLYVRGERERESDRHLVNRLSARERLPGAD